MGGPTWTPYELDTLCLLAGDVPWPALPQTYWNTVRQHGYPRRTATALRRKCNDLGVQRAAIGRWVNAGLICKLMSVSYEAVQTLMRSGLLPGTRFGGTRGHRYYFKRTDLRRLAITHHNGMCSTCTNERSAATRQQERWQSACTPSTK